MAAEVVWTPRSRTDLLEIYLEIAANHRAAAERFLTRIERSAATLSDHPRLGPRRPDIRPGTRVVINRPYLILYETHPDTDDGVIDVVEIVRVIDGRRDLRRLFR